MKMCGDTLNSAKVKIQKNPNKNSGFRSRSIHPSHKLDTMDVQHLDDCTMKHHQQQPLSTATFSHWWQEDNEKNGINTIVGNQHSRTLKYLTASTWLRNFSQFKTKYEQEHQQRQQQQQQQQQQRKHRHKQEHNNNWLLLTAIIVLLAIIENSMAPVKADENDDSIVAATKLPSTTPQYHNQSQHLNDDNLNGTTTNYTPAATTFAPITGNNESVWFNNSTASSHRPTTTTTTATSGKSSARAQKKFKIKYNAAEDSIFLRVAKRFTADNNLWSGIIQDCYGRPTFSCFQKNVYYYLNDVLDARDVNVTQRLKFFKNANAFQYDIEEAESVPPPAPSTTQASLAAEGEDGQSVEDNEIPDGRAFKDASLLAETPIEEVTNALYGKSVKFAMTHDIELKLPEIMFDGATLRISPQAIEGNGVIAKLELVPKQLSEARLAGKILMKKIQKFLKSKLLLSFLALVLIIKIIKIKLFWLLPLVIGVGAAKKLLLKFLLFLFPALTHLFKLCSYYQQTYHSTKFHHHHHHINHHHTIVPAWHNAEAAHIPEIIYTHPPKGHVSAYLHGAPIHESYGPHSHEHYENSWDNSGPGLGSEFISDINRVAHVDENANAFQPHSHNDANELHGWGLGTTPINNLAQSKKRGQQQQQTPNQLQKPPFNQAQQPLNYQKPQATSHTFNPFVQSVQPQPGDKPSFFNSKHRKNLAAAQSAPSPVYTPAKQAALTPPHNQLRPQVQGALTQAAQIAAQYDPLRNHQPQTQLTPELSAQLKEALRIQAEQRLVQQQQQILNKQPFAQDGEPLMPLNYDPFYSPILLKIDKIVEQLGVSDDLCKERLICSMYKDPQRYSPHSNFVSAELSRDTSELQPIKNTNEAVIRFFRLIQAARDGQDQKDCLILYPNCNINTE